MINRLFYERDNSDLNEEDHYTGIENYVKRNMYGDIYINGIPYTEINNDFVYAVNVKRIEKEKRMRNDDIPESLYKWLMKHKACKREPFLVSDVYAIWLKTHSVNPTNIISCVTKTNELYQSFIIFATNYLIENTVVDNYIQFMSQDRVIPRFDIGTCNIKQFTVDIGQLVYKKIVKYFWLDHPQFPKDLYDEYKLKIMESIHEHILSEITQTKIMNKFEVICKMELDRACDAFYGRIFEGNVMEEYVRSFRSLNKNTMISIEMLLRSKDIIPSYNMNGIFNQINGLEYTSSINYYISKIVSAVTEIFRPLIDDTRLLPIFIMKNIISIDRFLPDYIGQIVKTLKDIDSLKNKLEDGISAFAVYIINDDNKSAMINGEIKLSDVEKIYKTFEDIIRTRIDLLLK